MSVRTTNRLLLLGRPSRGTGTERNLVRVATFNINNVNKRLNNLLAWLAKAEPDVVSLQELKAEQGAFPVNALRTLGYEAVWQGERSWNGVAILARNHPPVLTCGSLPGNPEDHQARYIEAAVQGVLVTSIYLPKIAATCGSSCGEVETIYPSNHETSIIQWIATRVGAPREFRTLHWKPALTILKQLFRVTRVDG